MLINRHINIQDNKLSNGLQDVFLLMAEIGNSADAEDTIDFSNTLFVSPTFVLPLMIFAKGCGKTIRFSNVTPYLRRLYFGDGLVSDRVRRTEFTALMEGYAKKTFIPVINFPAIDWKEDEKSSILSTVESILTRQVGLALLHLAICWLMGLVDNLL